MYPESASLSVCQLAELRFLLQGLPHQAVELHIRLFRIDLARCNVQGHQSPEVIRHMYPFATYVSVLLQLLDICSYAWNVDRDLLQPPGCGQGMNQPYQALNLYQSILACQTAICDCT